MVWQNKNSLVDGGGQKVSIQQISQKHYNSIQQVELLTTEWRHDKREREGGEIMLTKYFLQGKTTVNDIKVLGL